MRRILLLILLAVSASTLAQTNKSTVRGTVKTLDGRAVESATIRLRKSGQQTKTDSNGDFILHSVPEGNHTLIVRLLGLVTKTVNLEVKAGESLSLPLIVLQQGSKELEEILIEGSINSFA